MTNTDIVSDSPRGWCRTDHQGKPFKQLGNVAGYYFDLKPRVLTVVALQELSQTLVRVRFTSDDDFTGFETLGPEDHIKLFFGKKANGEPDMPRIILGRWSHRNLTFRDYTVRWFDAENATLDVDFVLHDHGVAGKWAATAKVGDKLGCLGPRGSMVVSDKYPWYVLAADETALPALARWLEGLRPDVPVTAYVEVGGPGSHIPLHTQADLTVHWLERGDLEAGTSTLLADAVIAHTFPNLDGFVWVGGESIGIKPARRFLKDLGFARDHYKVDGYWRHGVANHNHHAEDDD
ncbi:MAG: siderophore-interacting protein [Actinomycetaceae bacterium]|nr:siderophore-interacting protein [Actinomycetaceae bacterium]